MAETTEKTGEKKLSVGSTKTLTLKPRDGVARQSFSHGRTKKVVVEKVKTRSLDKRPEEIADEQAKIREMRDAIERTEREAAEARKRDEDERHRREEETKRKAELEAKKRFGGEDEAKPKLTVGALARTD